MRAETEPELSIALQEASELFRQHLPFELGDYLVVEQIGQGGMGAIFLARHDAGVGVGRLVVLKTIRHDQSDDEYIRRFFDEARVVVRLSHRNLCDVYEVGQIAGRLYLSMEHVLGVDIRTLTQALSAQQERCRPPSRWPSSARCWRRSIMPTARRSRVRASRLGSSIAMCRRRT